MAIYFVKFRNGEEVIAEVYKNNDDLVMSEPMSLEYGQDDSERRLIYMSRYNPFCLDKTIRIPKSMVAYISKVIPEVQDYYLSSLDYCKQVMDDTFKRGIDQATKQAKQSLMEKMMEESTVETEDPVYPPNATKH